MEHLAKFSTSKPSRSSSSSLVNLKRSLLAHLDRYASPSPARAEPTAGINGLAEDIREEEASRFCHLTRVDEVEI